MNIVRMPNHSSIRRGQELIRVARSAPQTLADFFPGPDLSDVRGALLDRATMARYAPGQLIAVCGNDGAGIAFVLSGDVHATAESEDGREVVVSMKRAGEMLDELAWFDAAPLPLTLRAQRSGAELLSIGGRHVLALFRESPTFRIALLALTTNARRGLLGRIRELSFYLVRSRVARRLLAAAETGERVSMSGLAVTVATVPDVAARTIRQLEREGLVTFERGYARVVDRAALNRVADLAGRGDRPTLSLYERDAS